MQLIAITGRSPELSIAELESVFGADTISVVSENFVQIDRDGSVEDFNRLGGTLKVGKIIAQLHALDWRTVSEYVKKSLPDQLHDVPDGKITIGISVYGLKITPRAINGTALEIKKIMRQHGRSVRVVPNSALELNTAQVFHNKLASPSGMELLFIRNGSQTIIAQTIWVQNIDGYAARDQARPMRDARVGMLPPKLAQSIINLSGFMPGNALLDPFCGTGVILQETLLMGGAGIGTDLEPRMVEYTAKNLAWLENKYQKFTYELSVGDATSMSWRQSFDTIACETYLGRALSSLPDEQTLNHIVQDVNTIHKKFLQNVARQTKTGFKMCIAVPAWKTKHHFRHLPVLDRLEELGYNRVSFVHCNYQDLIYHRDNQTVARELVVLVRK